MMMLCRDMIALGSSAGSVAALRHLLAALPQDLPATVLVAQHQGQASELLSALIDVSSLPITYAEHGERLRSNHVYLAPADHHLLVDDDQAAVSAGPRENRARPAIDPLFRSAAAAGGSRLIAVQLTGALDDGVAGLDAVRRCGGLVVVQDPADAEFHAMPENALNAGRADHVVRLDEMAELLTRLVGQAVEPFAAPQDIVLEARLSLPGPTRPAGVERVGAQVPLSCPDCGGPMWQSGEGDSATFRCHVGHALSTHVLLGAQSESIERSLWVAVRTLSEQAATLHRLADSAHERSQPVESAYRARADEALGHADQARSFLLSLRGSSASSTLD